MEQANRRHLENTRVVQKNLVYVIGLNPKYANEEVRDRRAGFRTLLTASNFSAHFSRSSCHKISLVNTERFQRSSSTSVHHPLVQLLDTVLLHCLVLECMSPILGKKMLRGPFQLSMEVSWVVVCYGKCRPCQANSVLSHLTFAGNTGRHMVLQSTVLTTCVTWLARILFACTCTILVKMRIASQRKS